MDEVLLRGLQGICYADQQITKAIPKMIDQATNRDLAQGRQPPGRALVVENP